VLLRAKGEGVDVDTSVRGTGVVLERLDGVKVGTLTLGEAVLAVKLKLGGHNRVLTPAVHVKGGLSKHEGAGIRESGTTGGGINAGHVSGLVHLEHTTRDDGIGTRGGDVTTEGVEGVGKSINGISVVERLGTKGLEKGAVGLKGRAVVNVSIGLHNPHKLLTGVVEVELDLVGRRTDRLVTSELNLLDQILVGVLGHLAALIGIKEDVINIQRSGDQRLLVGSRHGLGTGTGSKGIHSPQALTDGAEINVDLHLVVLQSNEGKSKSGVAAVPELKGHVKGGLGESVAGSAHLGRSGRGSAGTRHGGEGRVGDVGKLSGVTDHLVVTRLLLLGKGQLVPDVHPVTVLTVDALASNLNLHLGDELLTNEIQPAGIHIARSVDSLVDLRKSHLKVGAVSKITVTGDGAGHATAEVSLSGEGLLDGLHREVSVASVRHLPESDFRGSSKEHVLGAVGDKLHKSSSHFGLYIVLQKKIILK